MKILWVKSGPLFPLNTGGRRRTHAMLLELAKDHEVTYLAQCPEGHEWDKEEDESPYAKDKIWIRSRETRENSIRFFLDLIRNFFLSTEPYTLDKYRNKDCRDRIVDLTESDSYDLVICDFLYAAVNLDHDRIKAPTLLFQHNVESQIWKRLASEKKNPVVRSYFKDQYRRMLRSEKKISQRFEGVVSVSPDDTEMFRKEYGLENVLGHVPTGVDTEYFSPEHRSPKKGHIGFLGSMDWKPNIESVHYFVSDIFPDIQKQHPDSRFVIIGRDPAPSVVRLAETHPNIEVTGTLVDIRPAIDTCELIVVPLRSGGGTRIKIFEAMSQGAPVVSTTVGAEGLPVIPGKDILIEDNPAAFAKSVCELLEDSNKAKSLSERARNKLLEEGSWRSVTKTFLRHCMKVVNP